MLSEKILMVMAHPDDELIFGWPILQNDKFDKEIIMCTSDRYNPERAWCSHRREPLLKLCADLDIKCTIFDYNSEFYRLPTRNGELSRMCETILNEIEKSNAKRIFTHNPWGEYGHLDHIVVHDIARHSSKDVYVSDMFVECNWVPWKNIGNYNKVFDWLASEEHSLNINFYNKYKKYYSDVNVWTWHKEPITLCRTMKL